MNSAEHLAKHAAATLPTNLPEQKEVLMSIQNILTAKHPAYPLVCRSLELIAQLEAVEAQLPAKFSQPEVKGTTK